MPREILIWLDWGELLRGPVDVCYRRCVDQGLAQDSSADRLRVAVCRAAALDHGRNPVALFLWLLRHPDADFALRYEDQARKDLAARPPRPVDETPTEPTPLSAMLGKYLKETSP